MRMNIFLTYNWSQICKPHTSRICIDTVTRILPINIYTKLDTYCVSLYTLAARSNSQGLYRHWGICTLNLEIKQYRLRNIPQNENNRGPSFAVIQTVYEHFLYFTLCLKSKDNILEVNARVTKPFTNKESYKNPPLSIQLNPQAEHYNKFCQYFVSLWQEQHCGWSWENPWWKRSSHRGTALQVALAGQQGHSILIGMLNWGSTGSLQLAYWPR